MIPVLGPSPLKKKKSSLHSLSSANSLAFQRVPTKKENRRSRRTRNQTFKDLSENRSVLQIKNKRKKKTMMKKSVITFLAFAVSLLLLAESVHADGRAVITRPHSLETACNQEIETLCHDSSDAGTAVSCLQNVSPSKVRRSCAAWVHAFAACQEGLKMRGSPCNLSRFTMQQCLRDVPFQDLPDACVTHDVFHQAKALSPARRGKHQPRI